jgi:hypothetical protein
MLGALISTVGILGALILAEGNYGVLNPNFGAPIEPSFGALISGTETGPILGILI